MVPFCVLRVSLIWSHNLITIFISNKSLEQCNIHKSVYESPTKTSGNSEDDLKFHISGQT